MRISLAWPLVVRFDGGSFNPPTSEEMCHALNGAWAGQPPLKAEAENGRHELSFEVPYFGAALYHIAAAKRILNRSFGINPDMEVDGVPIEVFAWRQNAVKIYHLGLIETVRRIIGRGNANDEKEAKARVAIRDGLNLTDAEIIAKVDAEARQEAR